jgi:transcriptional regulator with XRE-family HTH domain
MKDRILQIMHREGLTSARFAEVIGIQRSAMSHIMTGRNNPSLDVVTKILEKYPFINSDWLLFGKGEMVRKNTTVTQPDLFSSIPPKAPVIPPRNTVVSENRRETEVEKTQKSNKLPVQEPVIIKKTESRNVSKIIIYYSDNTYESFITEKINKD